MKKLLFILTIFLTSGIWSFGQTDDKPICISREAAESCATNAARVKALEAENAALRQALTDKDGVINTLKIEVALKTGENTALRQNAVQDRAIITAMIPMLRVKKFGLINLF